MSYLEKKEQPAATTEFLKSDSDVSFKTGTVSITGVEVSDRQLSIDKLYPGAITGDIGTVLELLNKSEYYLNEALKKYDENIIHSDEYFQQFQSILPDLVYFRDIGDGYGIVVSSLLLAITNRKGIPLEKNQLLVIKTIISKLRNEPFIRTQKSIEYCDQIKESGLRTDEMTGAVNRIIDEIIS